MILTSQFNNGSAGLLAVSLAINLVKMNQRVCLVSLQPFSENNKLNTKNYLRYKILKIIFFV